MKISLDWIREYVAVDLPRPELVDRLTMIGLVPETVEERDGDVVLDLETYANRPDTLGHLGVAREIGAALGLPLLERDWPLAELPESTAEIADVQIAAEALCPRYCGLVVRGVRVGPSPDWLRRRLEAIGLKPINNIVDVSNYVCFATAQPIHTFDFGRIGGGRIIVRKAKRGETLVDLDGRRLELAPEMLVIADETRPVALAGVIGGQASGITEATRDVFIESANFDPASIRKTAKKLGLSTDASYRFERGADIGFAPRAALMAASLLCRMGGKASRGLIDRFPRPPSRGRSGSGCAGSSSSWASTSPRASSSRSSGGSASPSRAPPSTPGAWPSRRSGWISTRRRTSSRRSPVFTAMTASRPCSPRSARST